jgi:lysophospholipase L1-like esterase
MPEHQDDSEMSRFDRENLRRFSARDSVVAVAVTMALLVLLTGSSVLHQGEEEKPGLKRDILTAIGKPVNSVADALPFENASRKVTATLSPDENLNNGGGFDQTLATKGTAGVPLVTPDAFDPVTIGDKPPPKRPLESLLVTGDSLAQPLDLELARKLTPDGVEVTRDAHPGTGISNPVLVDWGELSTAQIQDHHPQAVVVFIGANEGYPFPGPGKKQIFCCSPEWTAIFANRVRQMMNTYRQGGAARVYWMTVPTPRDPDRQKVEKAVNEAIKVAAQPWANQVRIVDTVPVFTPGEKYRDAMDVDGEQTIVRVSDGIHLNEVGSGIAADEVLRRVAQDFTYSGSG